MDKEKVVHICNGILLSNKKNEIMPFAATQMDLEMIMLSELRQRKINVIWYHLYVESKKKKGTNEVICKTETESHTAQTYGYQKGGGGERLTKLVGKIDYQQRPTVQHRELYSIFHNNL